MELRMNVNPTGKYVSLDFENPDSVAICDISGMVCNYGDLVKQMEWRGQRLVWTGLMVNKVFADKPNPQNIALTLPPDPVPLLNTRPPQVSSEGVNGPLVEPLNIRIAQLESVYFQSPG
jgi:hypothetical protein